MKYNEFIFQFGKNIVLIIFCLVKRFSMFVEHNLNITNFNYVYKKREIKSRWHIS